MPYRKGMGTPKERAKAIEDVLSEAGLLRCLYLKDISDAEDTCEKGFPTDITCESGEKVQGSSAYACPYYEPTRKL